MRRKPRGPNLFQNGLRAEAIETFAESSAHYGKNCTVFTTMSGKVFDASVPFQVAWVY